MKAMKQISLMLLVVVSSGLVGCQAPKNPALAGANGSTSSAEAVAVDGEEDKTKKGFHYSPFVLKVKSSSSVFQKISFKDVGIQGVDDASREGVYETIAESLSMSLNENMSLSMPASVVYDEEITDPANHLACGSDHLYVDVWQSNDPPRWGYSLWSGCGDDDNFVWKEISREGSRASTEQVKPLTDSIISELEKAKSRGCYQKTC